MARMTEFLERPFRSRASGAAACSNNIHAPLALRGAEVKQHTVGLRTAARQRWSSSMKRKQHRTTAGLRSEHADAFEAIASSLVFAAAADGCAIGDCSPASRRAGDPSPTTRPKEPTRVSRCVDSHITHAYGT